MYKIEKWAAAIAATFLVAILFAGTPIIYPVLNKFLDSPFLINSDAQILETQELLESLKYAGDINDIEDRTLNSEGIVYVTNEKVNIRSYPEVVDDNIIGGTTMGNYFLYFDTEQVGDTTWYQIQKRDDLAEGWVSGITVQEVANYENKVENFKAIKEFMDQYSQIVIKANETYDFAIIEPFLLPTGLMYEEQRNYINHIRDEQIKPELLSYKLIDGYLLKDGQVWIRTIELYNITSSDGNVHRKDFISEYLLTVDGENDFKVNRLLGTYQQNL